jgi:cell division protein FtsA
LPAGLVLSGGGSKLTGMVQYAKHRLGLTVKLANESNLEAVVDTVNDPAYAVAVGLALWGLENEQTVIKPGIMDKIGTGGFRKLVNWVKDFIP